MKRQAGFTLIELVMVIVILGILSAFALPRFADLGGDAREASIKGAYGAVKSATSIAHADALVKGKTGATDTIDLEGQTINMVFGYPTSADIVNAAQISDFTVATSSATPPVTTISAKANCSFTYTQATSATVPAVISTLDDSGCQ